MNERELRLKQKKKLHSEGWHIQVDMGKETATRSGDFCRGKRHVSIISLNRPNQIENNQNTNTFYTASCGRRDKRRWSEYITKAKPNWE